MGTMMPGRILLHWSQAVRREPVGGGVHYDFPVRPLGAGKLIGVFLAGFGILFIRGPLSGIAAFVESGLHGSIHGIEIAGLVFEIPFLIAGMFPLLLGLLVVFGRCRVTWQEGALSVSERLGPLSWTRRMPACPIRKLEIRAPQIQKDPKAPPSPSFLAALSAEFENGTKRVLLVGYPKEWLAALAQELKAPIDIQNLNVSVAEPVMIVERSLGEEEPEEVLAQPDDSLILVQEDGRGLCFHVPPDGFRRGAMGLLFFGVFWCVLVGIFTVLLVLSSLDGRGGGVAVILFLSLFWAIGLGLITGAIHLGKRSALLRVEGGRLSIETRSVFGTRLRAWGREELASIRAGRSQIEVNDQVLIELQLHLTSRKKVGVLTGRKPEELCWLAGCLRRALDVPAS